MKIMRRFRSLVIPAFVRKSPKGRSYTGVEDDASITSENQDTLSPLDCCSAEAKGNSTRTHLTEGTCCTEDSSSGLMMTSSTENEGSPSEQQMHESRMMFTFDMIRSEKDSKTWGSSCSEPHLISTSEDESESSSGYCTLLKELDIIRNGSESVQNTDMTSSSTRCSDNTSNALEETSLDLELTSLHTDFVDDEEENNKGHRRSQSATILLSSSRTDSRHHRRSVSEGSPNYLHVFHEKLSTLYEEEDDGVSSPDSRSSNNNNTSFGSSGNEADDETEQDGDDDHGSSDKVRFRRRRHQSTDCQSFQDNGENVIQARWDYAMEIMNSVQEVHCSSPSELLRKMSYDIPNGVVLSDGNIEIAEI
mmetsp:Transcript_9386/g.17005  ORF Transcript_9386/g.17005 Transcript_9386/m.17005 type:complete len:363 (-) Transcript_9386:408-1496(-)